MIKNLLIAIILLTGFKAYPQVYLNPGVDTTFAEVKTALRFYNTYLFEFKGRQIPDLAKYWPADEMKLRTIPDQQIYALNNSPLYSQGYRPTIIYIRPGANFVQIKTQFSTVVDSAGNIMTMAVTNHYIAIDDKGKPYFINPLTINLKEWRTKTVRNVSFHYPAYHKFNAARADSLVKSISGLEKEWGLKPININYYFAGSADELYKLRGFDYALLMGNKLKPSGISDDKDNQVFCGGLGENYFHEVVHIYLNHLYSKSPIQEGLAVLFAGSMGRPVKWHLKRVNQYLKEHPKIDLTDLNEFWYTDHYTNPGSAIQGMLCQLIYQKDGVNGLKRLMQHISYNQIFEKEFNIPKNQINSFLRKTISEQAEN